MDTYEHVFHISATLSILALAGWSFVKEVLPPDLTAILAILGLLVSGVLEPREAFGGFSHPATISVAAVLVLSAGVERTGVLGLLARTVLARIGGRETLLTVALVVVVGTVSAFINNTAAVAIAIPLVFEVCRKTGARPGRLLMPMAFAATFGGFCTLVGTSTNLVTHELARSRGLDGFGMFELGRVGLPMALAGAVWVVFASRRLLPETTTLPTADIGPRRAYVADLVIQPGSPWIGRELTRSHFPAAYDVELIHRVRGSVTTGETAAPPLVSRVFN